MKNIHKYRRKIKRKKHVVLMLQLITEKLIRVAVSSWTSPLGFVCIKKWWCPLYNMTWRGLVLPPDTEWCVAHHRVSDACKSAPEASRRLHSSGASHASYRGPELVWATGRLMSPDRGFGTSCLLHCGHLTVSANSEDSWKLFCLSRTRLWCLVTFAFRCRI